MRVNIVTVIGFYHERYTLIMRSSDAVRCDCVIIILCK